MADILQKIKDWDLTNKDSSITMNLDYTELTEISDVVDRKLWFIGEVDENIIGTMVYNILRYNAMDKDIPVEKRKPIVLFLSSIGGETVAGMSLVSAILTSKTPVYTVNLSQCCSIALVMYLVGHKRYSMPNSVFLMHEGVSGAYESTSKAKQTIYFYASQYEEVIKTLTIDKTLLTKKEYEKKYKDEWYFLPDEAKKYGFTDYIIGEDCEIDEIL